MNRPRPRGAGACGGEPVVRRERGQQVVEERLEAHGGTRAQVPGDSRRRAVMARRDPRDARVEGVEQGRFPLALRLVETRTSNGERITRRLSSASMTRFAPPEPVSRRSLQRIVWSITGHVPAVRRQSWPGSSLRAPVRRTSQSTFAPTRSAPASLGPAAGAHDDRRPLGRRNSRHRPPPGALCYRSAAGPRGVETRHAQRANRRDRRDRVCRRQPGAAAPAGSSGRRRRCCSGGSRREGCRSGRSDARAARRGRGRPGTGEGIGADVSRERVRHRRRRSTTRSPRRRPV